MKTKRTSLSSQVLILVMATLVLLLLVQLAQAQTNDPGLSTFTQGSNQNLLAQSNFQNQNTSPQVLQTGMPQKSTGRRIWENTTLTYYQQFLGPTADGNTTRTYNVFQEGIDTPNSGFAPMQSFHALNLRYQINTNWAVGATWAVTNGYTKEVINKNRYGETFPNTPSTQTYNARAYLAFPPMRFTPVTFFTTVSAEAPTSELSRDNGMKYGWVVAQNASFNLPSLKWNAGFNYQAYRMYYQTNVQPPPFPSGRPTPMQTMIISGGPYANYRFSDKWQLGSVLTFDWDQRGVQSGSREFNNNLPHRGRMSLTYFPQSIRFLQSVGLFSQALLKFSPQTTAVGADFSLRF